MSLSMLLLFLQLILQLMLQMMLPMLHDRCSNFYEDPDYTDFQGFVRHTYGYGTPDTPNAVYAHVQWLD